MNSRVVVGVCLSLVALAAIYWVVTSNTKSVTTSRTTAATSAQADKKSSASIPPAVAPPAKPADIYFLSESAPVQDPNRHTVVKQIPKANGTRRVSNSRAITTQEEGDFMAPRWSPDGLELMFSKAGYHGLYTKGSNGGALNEVTGEESVGFGAKWNDEGQIEAHKNGKKQTLRPDGTPVDSTEFEADTSLTGAFTKDDTVYVRANPGEAPIPVSASGDDKYFGGVLSPDGKYVAYNGLVSGVYIAPVDGSTPPVNIGPGVSPSWIPDSSGVVYTITEDDGHNLVAGDLFHATVDGTQISNLTQTPDKIEQHPSVSTDGSIAFESGGTILVGVLN